MENPHDAMVSRLSSLLTDCFRDHPRYTVVTNCQWQPLAGFPKYVLGFDLMVIECGARWQTGVEGALLGPQTAPVTAIDVASHQMLKRDLIDKPDLLNVTGLYEYALYDPTGEVLRPSLQVFRRRARGTSQVPTALNGAFFSALGLQFQFEGNEVWVAPSGPVQLEEELYLLRFPLIAAGQSWDDSPEATARRRQLEEQIAAHRRREEP